MKITMQIIPILSSIVLLFVFLNCSPNLVVEETIPQNPIVNDSSFKIKGLRSWYLFSNTLTNHYSASTIQINPERKIEKIRSFIDKKEVHLFKKDSMFHFSGMLNCSGLSTGKHELLLSADNCDTAFAVFTFAVTHPLLVMVSNDWEAPDVTWEGNNNATLLLQEKLHTDHPGLVLTYFVGPYTFTSSAISFERKEYIKNWLISMRDSLGDEIGLHIHGRKDFISVTGVPFRSGPTTSGIPEDSTGYSVLLSSYTQDEFFRILLCADSIFTTNGLGSPKSFRAGGWTAGAHTLRALSDQGFLVDASKVNWRRFPDDPAYNNFAPSVKQMWNDCQDTSQPYFPFDSVYKRPLEILEIPDNGVLVDQVSLQTMKEIFSKIWNQEILHTPKEFSIGYHPVSLMMTSPNRSSTNYNDIDSMLFYIDSFSIYSDKGPCMYVRMIDSRKFW